MSISDAVAALTAASGNNGTGTLLTAAQQACVSFPILLSRLEPAAVRRYWPAVVDCAPAHFTLVNCYIIPHIHCQHLQRIVIQFYIYIIPYHVIL